MKRLRAIAPLLALFFSASFSFAEKPEGSMDLRVSMPRPSTHYVHVEFRCDSIRSEVLDFKLPVWTPGYYIVMDYARNVQNFSARDGAGQPLDWQKTSKSTWRVKSANTSPVVVSYDVYAFGKSVVEVEGSVDDDQAFLSPTSLFLYVAGRLQHPVTVTVVTPHGWERISTGLEAVPNRPGTYLAPDFDVLYDSPILIGNQEVLRFDVRGIPHEFVGRNLGSFDRDRFVADLKAMVESAAKIFGEIPYTHYTFMAVGPGRGGLEHLNSQAITFDGGKLNTPAEYKRVMSFISHEYFHHYNVKRIRPIALGPFDYERENYTNMLWVAEGLTVYYEDQVLLRSGFYTPKEYLERLHSVIVKLENGSGHRFMSATDSSFAAWSGYFNLNEHQLNTGISYYDKGCALGTLLDFAIRHESKNRKSLDDVMRNLYQVFYKEKKRGFTDREFRQVCEDTAGTSLYEIFDLYASSTAEIDYRKYFAWAGLEIDVEAREQAGAYLGALTEERDGALVISRVEPDSPAAEAGLMIQDEILAFDTVRVTGRNLNEILTSQKPGEKVRILIARRGRTREIEVAPAKKTERSFRITPMKTSDPLQAAIRKDWLREPSGQPSETSKPPGR